MHPNLWFFLLDTLCPSSLSSMSIAENIARVREPSRLPRGVQPQARRNHPDGSQQDVPARAYPRGLRGRTSVFGENRVQEFAGKGGALLDLRDAEWHMIGHLQTNKAGKAAELFAAVDSVDSLRLAQKINDSAQNSGKKLNVLIEINVGGEKAKTGVVPESTNWNKSCAAHPMGESGISRVDDHSSFTDDPHDARPYFRRLREVRDQLAARRLPAIQMHVLSMGMSHDFEVAVEEGSTCVRVGTAIFGERTKA